MADLGQDPGDFSADLALKVRGDVEIQSGSDEATVVNVPATATLPITGVDAINVTTDHQVNVALNRTLTDANTGVLDTSTWNDYDLIYINGSSAEIQNIPQPLDSDGNVTGKVLMLFISLATSQLTIRNNTGASPSSRFELPGFIDAKAFRDEVVILYYNVAGNRWNAAFKYGVIGRQTLGGSQLVGKEIVWDVGSFGGLAVTVTEAAGQLRVTHSLDNVPLDQMEDIGDDTWLGNISGGSAPPTANSLSSLGGNFLSYNASTHAFDVNLASVTYTAGDGLDLSGTQFSADVSDFAGTGLQDDGSNNLRVAFDSGVTLTPSGSGTISIDASYSHIRIDPIGSFTCTGITGGYAGQVVFVNMTTGGGDEVIWQDDGTTTQTPYNQDIIQNQGETVMLWRASNGESKWYILPQYPVLRPLTGAIERDAFSTSTRFAGIRTNGSLQTSRTHLNFIDTSTITWLPSDDAGSDEWEMRAHLATGGVTNAHLDNMAAGTAKGRQIDAGTGAPVDLTGFELGEMVRWNITETENLADGSHDSVPLDQRTFWVNTDPNNTVEVTGAAFADGNSGHIMVWTKNGNSGQVQFPDEDTGSSETERWSVPEDETVILTQNTERCLWGHDGARFNLLSVVYAAHLNTPTRSDREIIIHNGTEDVRENLATAAEPLDFDWTGEHEFNSAFALTGEFTTSTASQIDDLNIGDVSIVKITPTASIQLTGMVPHRDGQFVYIVNAATSGNSITLVREDTDSSANNRFIMKVTSLTLGSRDMWHAWYDGTENRWRIGGTP